MVADIVARQAQADWGSGFLNQLNADLMHEFTEMKGFSASNLKYIRQWHQFWVSCQISQQPVGQLTKQPVEQIFSIPWGHNLAIIAKCKQHDEALYYVQPASLSANARPRNVSNFHRRTSRHSRVANYWPWM